ncbi:MAG TPA: NapC/NirT family cytochrome c [Myxococcota bacterium]|nr:NapC/NirT family cytochrome c [Myxococcota bacterium]
MSDPEVVGTSPPKRPVIAVFTSHWLAMVGLGLVMTGIIGWLFLLPAQLRRGQENPYIGIATTAAGAVLLLGVAITPIGLHFGRRRLAQRLGSFQDKWSAWRRLFTFLAVTSLLNLLIASQTTLRAVHFMESEQFCTSCHVHVPQARSFDQGPHAGIMCVDCHVGEGTRGLIQSKLQGTEQLMSILTDSVKVPIETAIERGRMVPSAETCEDCHWKEQPAKASVKLIQRYAEDEANTPSTTLLTMNVGGRVMGGIHGAHHGEGIEIQFVAMDPKRQDIPLVEYRNSKTKESRTYVKKGADPAAFAGRERLTMQCFDCHNRPAHAFQMPDRAVDRAILLGRMSDSLPFLKKASMEILQAPYATGAAAAAEIPKALASYYQKDRPEVAKDRAADVAQAGLVLADIYSRNVFPEHGVTWGTYVDNRGHQTAPGCFRCHDGEHVTPSGEEISNNCFVCHFPAAVEETKPEVLQILGVDKLLKSVKKK